MTKTTITDRWTLGDLVTELPSAARVLEGHGLDYCCGGTQTLAAACEVAQLNSAAVLEQLTSLPPEARQEWTDMTPGALVDHLEETHHAYLAEELPRLTALADKVTGVHGDRHPELTEVQRLFTTLREELEPHLLKEERILFPMIRQLDGATAMPTLHCDSVQNPIAVMLLEHDRAGELLAELRAVTNDHTPPPDGCASYEAFYRGLAELERDTHLHVHKENNRLFPAVIEMESQLR